MKRTPLGIGAKSAARGSTFAAKPQPLKRTASKRRASSFTPASKEQRAKVAERVSIISATGPCDPCHLVPRSHGGCDHPDCVIPLTREEHRAFDDGTLDILPYLIAHSMWAELGHAITEHHYDPIRLAERCTGVRFVERTSP